MGQGSLSAFTRVFDALWAGTTRSGARDSTSVDHALGRAAPSRLRAENFRIFSKESARQPRYGTGVRWFDRPHAFGDGARIRE
jgi:hypothetical protein